MTINSDYGVSLAIEAPLVYRGEELCVITGFAYSWPNAGTLLSVEFAGEEIPDPYLYRADDPMDEVVSKALWKEARARADDLQSKFDEYAVPVLQMVNG